MYSSGPKTTRHTNISIILFLVLFTYTVGLPNSARAQLGKYAGVIGIGAQVGTPTGLTLKYYASQDIGFVFLGSWSLDRFLLFSMHTTYEYPIPDSPLRFFIGPGLEIGREGNDRYIRYAYKRYLDARVEFLSLKSLRFSFKDCLASSSFPEVKITLGGAVGLRYFLLK